MPRFTPLSARDETQATDGDTAFRGVYDKGEPDKNEPGMLRSAVNCTCRDQTVRTRLGSQTPFSHIINVQNIYGSGIFSDPFGGEWLLRLTANEVVMTRDGSAPILLSIPTSTLFGIPSNVPFVAHFVQAFRTVLIFRGSDQVPWAWDGDIMHGFQEINQLELGDGTVAIPNGPDRFGLNPILLLNRLIVPHERSQIAISDTFVYDRYDPAFADFNLTGGNDETLVALARYTGYTPGGSQATILVFNTQSIQMLTGIDTIQTLPVPTSQLDLQPVNDSIGCVSGATVARLGADMLFLSDNGVFQLTEVEQRRQTAPVPLTDAIDSTINRINWHAAPRSVAIVHGEYYYLAAPIDGSGYNNVILPYNSQLQAWQGIHTFPAGIRIDALHRLDWFGSKRLHAVDYTTGRVHLLYEGRHDIITDTRYDISMSLSSRAYLLESADRKRVKRLRAYVKSWAPSTSLSVDTDGVNERENVFLSKTRDRTKYSVFGRPSYQTSNVDGDHAVRSREDYSVDISTPFNPDTQGIDFDLEQQHRFAAPVTMRGRTASLNISNEVGTLSVIAVAMEGEESENTDRNAP